MKRFFSRRWTRPALVLILLAAFMAAPAISVLAEAPGAGGEARLVASYLVENGKLAEDPGSQAEPDGTEVDSAALWRRIWAIVPAPCRPYIASFELLSYGPDREDEEVESDASTYLREDGRTWALSVDRELAVKGLLGEDREACAEFERTIAHEIGHILSLNASQIDPSGSVKGTFLAEEGRTLPDSWMNRFYGAFWKGRYGLQGDKVSKDDGAALNAAHPGDFVTEYAAAGPTEDFAESFADFVTKEQVRGDGLAARKIAFFYSIPELAALRDPMRLAMGGLR
jgi:hypothetical protein